MSFLSLLPYIAVMAAVTYLIRALPLVAVRGRIRSRFILSFLRYVPFAVLGAMTFPAVIGCTGNMCSSLAGLAAAVILAWREKSMIVVALSACGVALAVNLLLIFL